MRKELLEILEKDSRISVQDLAIMLGETPEAVQSEMQKMQEEQIIAGYHTMINWDKTEDERVTALIEVKVVPQRDGGFDKIAKRIYEFEEVSSVYLMSGAFDLTVIVEGRSMKEVALFVRQRLAVLDPVTSTATHFVLKKYKDNGILMEPEKRDERMIVSP